MKMKRLLALVLAGAFWMSGLHADEQSAQSADAGLLPGSEAVDAGAIEALDLMGSYLRSLDTFSLQAEDRIDEVLDSGQKIQLSASIYLQVRRPDKLRAEIETDRKSRRIIYDGKTFTLAAPTMGFFTTVPAPPTIGETLMAVEAKFGVAIPLIDLFLWGKDPNAVTVIQSAIALGPSKVGGQAADHYAFRQDGLDWQIWIAQGDAPLPLRYVITTTDEPEQPQYGAELTWDTGAEPADGAFTFTPTENDHRIDIVVLDDAPAAN